MTVRCRPGPLSRSRSTGRSSGQDGAVTAELALAMPTLVLLLVVGLWLQGAVALQARCQDAARAGARAAARGDADDRIRGALVAALPSGAAVTIGRAGDVVTVRVTARPALPGALAGLVAAPQVSATAVATAEQAGTLSGDTPGGATGGGAP